jgi:hypothetical protein
MVAHLQSGITMKHVSCLVSLSVASVELHLNINTFSALNMAPVSIVHINIMNALKDHTNIFLNYLQTFIIDVEIQHIILPWNLLSQKN